MKQREISGPSNVQAAPTNVGSYIGSKPVHAAPPVALKSAKADRYRHRVDRAQSEVAKLKGFRKGRGTNEGPAGRFELTEHVSFDDGWGSGQVRFEVLVERRTTVS